VFVEYGLRDLSMGKDCSDLETTLLKVCQS
jgi:hypothetical protein